MVVEDVDDMSVQTRWPSLDRSGKRRKLMNKWLITMLATFTISGVVVAGEEINLAAAVGAGVAVQPTAVGTDGAATSTAVATTTADMVALGIIAASGLAAVANSDSSSSTSH